MGSHNSSFEALKTCVLLPTYNNEQTLRQVIESILRYTDHIIIVNDGATDTTREILCDYQQLTIVHFEQNQGKGKALREGFKKAYSLGYRQAIAIDSDGQHLASDLPKFLVEIEKTPDALLLGARNMESENVPGKSSFGNKFSNFWYLVNTGIELPDTQSGYRAYPVHLLHDINWKTDRFEFEIEVLVRAAWKGIEVRHVVIEVYYPPADERVSHFRTVRDFARISVLNTIFVVIALVSFWPRKIVKEAKEMGPREVMRKYFYDPNESTQSIVLSVMLGVFFGITPFWGYQILLILVFAHLFKLNKAIAFVAGNISIPPMIPFILFGSYILGGICIGNHAPESFDQEVTFELVGQNLWQYVVGAFVLATLASLAFGLLSYVLLLFLRRKKESK